MLFGVLGLPWLRLPGPTPCTSEERIDKYICRYTAKQPWQPACMYIFLSLFPPLVPPANYHLCSTTLKRQESTCPHYILLKLVSQRSLSSPEVFFLSSSLLQHHKSDPTLSPANIHTSTSSKQSRLVHTDMVYPVYTKISCSILWGTKSGAGYRPRKQEGKKTIAVTTASPSSMAGARL